MIETTVDFLERNYSADTDEFYIIILQPQLSSITPFPTAIMTLPGSKLMMSSPYEPSQYERLPNYPPQG